MSGISFMINLKKVRDKPNGYCDTDAHICLLYILVPLAYLYLCCQRLIHTDQLRSQHSSTIDKTDIILLNKPSKPRYSLPRICTKTMRPKKLITIPIICPKIVYFTLRIQFAVLVIATPFFSLKSAQY